MFDLSVLGFIWYVITDPDKKRVFAKSFVKRILLLLYNA